MAGTAVEKLCDYCHKPLGRHTVVISGDGPQLHQHCLEPWRLWVAQQSHGPRPVLSDVTGREYHGDIDGDGWL